ncbi:MAG: DUF4340 domain-containing protein [Treponema sp.]|jgi:hypothetical protein|nr:DUF4340 domain-containing protein [Treponema sp.]
MTKKLIFMGVMALLLASLGVVFVLLNREEPKTSSSSSSLPPAEYVADLSGEEYGGVASVTVKNAGGEFTVSAGDPPVLEAYNEYVTNNYPLSRTISVSQALYSRETVADNPEDLALFGLDAPRAEVRIRPVKGGELILHVGSDAPDGYSVYVRKEGSPSVYLANSSDTENYLKKAVDFFDLEISPAGEQEGAMPDFERIVLGGAVRNGQETAVYKSEEEETDTKRVIANPLRISAGSLDGGLNMDKGWNALSPLFGLSADRVAAVAGEGDLARYGLDKPYSTAAVSGTLGQGLGGFSLRVSKPDASGNVYIRREGSDLVYEAAASKLPWLELGWFDLMNHMIILPFIDSVAKVEVITPRRTVTFALSGEEDDLKVSADGKEIETSHFRTYYQTLLYASYDEYTTETLPPGAAPFLEIRYHYRSGSPADTVSFYATGSRRVLVSFNGAKPFYTLSVYTDRVLADLDSLLAGNKVMPYI